MTKTTTNPTENANTDPFSTLPDNLILEIFGHLQDKTHYLGSVIPRVCKRWNLLSRLPQLWTQLTLNLGAMANSQVASILQSKPYLKALQLNCHSSGGSLYSDDLKNILLTSSCRTLQCLTIVDYNNTIGKDSLLQNIFRSKLPNLLGTSIQHIELLRVGVDDGEVLQLCQALPNLSSLEIRWCIGVSSSGVNAIAKHLHRLQVFLLAPVVTDGSANKWDRSLGNLLSVHRHHLIQLELNLIHLTENALRGIQNCENVAKLCLTGCDLFSDRLLILISEMPKLSALKLDSVRLTESSWDCFFDKKTLGLKALDLEFSGGISDDILAKLATQSPQLNYLRLWDWSSESKISDRGLETILGQCPDLKVLVLQNLDQITPQLFRSPQQLAGLCVNFCKLLSEAELTNSAIKHFNWGSRNVDPFAKELCRH